MQIYLLLYPRLRWYDNFIEPVPGFVCLILRDQSEKPVTIKSVIVTLQRTKSNK